MCKTPGCPKLVEAGKSCCEEHTRQQTRQYDRQRGTANQRGYNANWRKVRKMKLASDPLCERCKADGRLIPATLVHHKDRDPRNNSDENLMSLCNECHETIHRDEGERW